MALHHASPGEIIDLNTLGAAAPESFSRALFRGEQLEVLRMVLQAGKNLPEHELEGEGVLQCLNGVVVLKTAGSTRELKPGQVVCLAKGEPYSIEALQDTTLLLTVVLPLYEGGVSGRVH